MKDLMYSKMYSKLRLESVEKIDIRIKHIYP